MSRRDLFRSIQAITFDVTNVLLTVRNSAAYQYARLAREHLAIPSIDQTVLQKNFIQAFRTLNQSHPGYGIHTNISSRQWWTMIVEHTFKDSHLSSEQSNRLGEIIYDQFARSDLWVKHPQADQVLKELQKRGKILGVISNFDERLESLLEQHQLRDYFQFILAPRNCGFYKPQKEIFIHAVKLTGVKSNENLCHVGDDIKLDYQAGHAAGCQVLLLTKNKQNFSKEHPEIDEWHLIENLDELLEIFSADS